MNRPLAFVALLYVSGVLLGGLLSPRLPWLFACSLGLAGASFVWSAGRVYLLSLLAVLTGWTNLATRTAVISPWDLRTLVGVKLEFVTLRGTLCDTPSQRVYEDRDKESWRTLARINVVWLRRDTDWHPAFGRVAVATPGLLGADFFGGQTIEVTGVIRPPQGPAAEGLFDYRTFLRRQGVYYQLLVESTNDWRTVSTGGRPPRPPLADRFRQWSQKILAAGLPNEDESLHLLWAMALGWTTALTDEVSEPFMRTGTMHIFAISGLHIALIAGILVSLLRVLQIPRALCGWLVIPLIWFYTAATGWQSSAIRSTIMMSVIIVGWAIKRPSDLLNSLAAAGFIILLWDPQQLFQASFQLSFFVVLSIALLMPPIERLRQRLLEPDPLLPPELRPGWRRWLDGPIRFLTTSLATSLAAWLGSLPLIAHYFHLFTPVSLAANLVIVPFSSLALMCNLGSLLCGGWCPWLSELFNHSGWFWMAAMVGFSDWFASLPGAYCYVPAPTPVGSILYYALLFGIVSGKLFAPRIRAWSAAAVCLLAVIGCLHWFNHRNDTRITILPLTGGDSIFVDAPGRAHDLLVDCGNESAAEFLVKPFLHGQGVNRLPHLLLTHGDVRHIGGASRIASEFAVGQFLASSVRFRSPAYRQIPGNLDSTSERLRPINRGDQFGAWTVLHPEAQDRFPEADDKAIVLRGELNGVRVLLCSDLGRPGQRTLRDREQDLHAGVVVAGIPSKSEPLGDALLDAVQPRVVIVSASEVPSQERATKDLRARLERRGIPVFYTSDDGAVTITLRPKTWEVRTMSGKQFASEDR
jgi:ComEC/Rec2-related protein